MGALLQLVGKGSDHQIAAEAQRRSGEMQFAPAKPQILGRPVDQFGNFTIWLHRARLSWSVVPARPGRGDGSPECWRADMSWVGGVICLPAR